EIECPTNRPAHQLVEALELFALDPTHRLVMRDREPVALHGDPAPRRLQEVSRRKASDAFVIRLARVWPAAADVVCEGYSIESWADVVVADERIERGGEEQTSPHLRVEEWMETECVPGAKESLLSAVPDRPGVDAVEPV